MNTFSGQYTGCAAPMFPADGDYSVKSDGLLDRPEKCTYSRAVSTDDFPCDRGGRRKPASGIGSGNVKQRGTWVILFSGKESHTRSVAKAISWRILGTLDTFVISWYLTGKVALAGSIAALEFLTKIVWYYAHERVWASIAWGRGLH